MGNTMLGLATVVLHDPCIIGTGLIEVQRRERDIGILRAGSFSSRRRNTGADNIADRITIVDFTLRSHCDGRLVQCKAKSQPLGNSAGAGCTFDRLGDGGICADLQLRGRAVQVGESERTIRLIDFLTRAAHDLLLAA